MYISYTIYDMVSITQCFGLALPGSRTVHAPTTAQAIYIATQGPQALRDLCAAWSCHLCMMQLCKSLCACISPCAHALGNLSMPYMSSPHSSYSDFLRPAHMSLFLLRNSESGFHCVFRDLFSLVPGNFIILCESLQKSLS